MIRMVHSSSQLLSIGLFDGLEPVRNECAGRRAELCAAQAGQGEGRPRQGTPRKKSPSEIAS